MENSVAGLDADVRGSYNYVEKSVSSGESVAGLYEYNETDHDYVETQDTTAQSGKHYFERTYVSGLMDKVEEQGEGLSDITREFRSVLKLEEDRVVVGAINPDTGEFVAGNYRTEMSDEGILYMYRDPDNDQDVLVARYGADVQLGAVNGTHMVANGSHLAFVSGDGVEVAYIDIDQHGDSVFYMTRSVVVKDMFFGDGMWKWYKRSNNNMSLKWMGAN
jgi:hypothetical protein